ncbi:hypothetical protein JTB14_025914 [Gonioctena quinquepunctata]|nr:hypothetical protein JTB14_025914 [Gonioctena quinquepunctata]
MKKNWIEITNMLNSIPNAPAKEWTQWRKTWVDIKKNTKTRFVKEKKHARGTGGGPPLPPNLETSLDEKILNIIPMVTIKGDDNIQESLVPFLEDDAVLYEGYENEQTTSEQNQNYDHMYSCNNEVENTGDKTAPTHSTNSAPCQTAPSCSSQIYSTSTKKKMRTNKTSRLQESLKTNARFIDINEKKFSDDKIYQDKKISLMETKLKNREIFEDRVASALESIAESLGKLASGISKT